MIKKYLEFINENYNSIGEWIESLSNDEYINNIINRYIKDIDPSISLSNAINILNDNDKNDIKYQIDNYLKNGIIEKNPIISTSVEIDELNESDISSSGKGIFTSFLKSLTAMGQKESKPNWDICPSDFLLYYHYNNLNSDLVKQIFSRFRSLSRYIDLIDYGKNEVDIYFGVKCNGQFEYGLDYDKIKKRIGEFKLSQSVIRWICNIESKSASSIKKELVNLSYNDIITLGKIKYDMNEYKPGYYENRMNPIISDKIISFGYHGLGKWDNGKLDNDDLVKIKNNFTNWILTKKWNNKVLISIKSSSFWVYMQIKLK